MGEVIRFVSRSEQERNRLIERARAIYESVFPTVDPQQQWAPVVQSARVTNVRRIEERLPR
jgi:hypothetical protein